MSVAARISFPEHLWLYADNPSLDVGEITGGPWMGSWCLSALRAWSGAAPDHDTPILHVRRDEVAEALGWTAEAWAWFQPALGEVAA